MAGETATPMYCSPGIHLFTNYANRCQCGSQVRIVTSPPEGKPVDYVVTEETAKRLAETIEALVETLRSFPICGHGYIAAICRLCMRPLT
jgi:hypothetical protein